MTDKWEKRGGMWVFVCAYEYSISNGEVTPKDVVFCSYTSKKANCGPTCSSCIQHRYPKLNICRTYR